MATLTLGPRLFDHPGALLDGRGMLFDEPAVERPQHAQPDPSPDREAHVAGGRTLEDVIVGRWQQVTSGASAPCPVCHGELRPVWGPGSRPVGARCQDCGSRLS